MRIRAFGGPWGTWNGETPDLDVELTLFGVEAGVEARRSEGLEFFFDSQSPFAVVAGAP